MKKLTITGAEALKDIARRDGFEMVKIEYPSLYMLETTQSPMVHTRTKTPQRVLVNIRGKHHASWWMKGKREEFGIPATEFATYTEMAKSLNVPMYFIFYEETSKTVSCISSNEVLLKARIWDKDNVDKGGTLFVPKRYVFQLARLEGDKIRYINNFRPENFSVQTVLV